MSSSKFKFVSPGVFLNEIDNSQLTAIPDAIGPIVIGRFPRGPAFQPVRVSSFSQFIEIFGNPQSGGQGEDVWREGNDKLAPTYASYAVQAYLRNSSPVNVVRLQGIHHENRTTNGFAGWQAKNTGSADSGEATVRNNAYALLVGNMHDPTPVALDLFCRSSVLCQHRCIYRRISNPAFRLLSRPRLCERRIQRANSLLSPFYRGRQGRCV